MNLSKSLRRLRLEAGISQGDLADLLGVSQAVVSYWESGERVPPLETIVRIANIYGAPLDEVVGRTGSFAPTQHLSQEEMETLGEVVERMFQARLKEIADGSAR